MNTMTDIILTFEQWTRILLIIIIILIFLLGTIASPYFWKVVKRNKKSTCPHCGGDGLVDFLGEGFSENCEHCKGTGKI